MRSICARVASPTRAICWTGRPADRRETGCADSRAARRARRARARAPARRAALDPERARDVVRRRPGIEPVEEPQALLGEGQRQRCAGPGRAEPARSAERSVAASGPLAARASRRTPRAVGARTGCAAARRSREPSRSRAMTWAASSECPPRCEEVVVRAHALEASRAAPDLGDQRALGRGARRHVGVGAGCRVGAGRGQRAAVDLAVGGERQRVERRRTPPAPCSRAAARAGARRSGRASGRRPRGRHDVGDEAAVSRGRSCDGGHDRLARRRVARQRGLDLAELDAEAADLDLVVGAAEELQVAVGAATARGRRCGTSARRARRRTDRRRTLRGQLRVVAVAARQARRRRCRARPATPVGHGLQARVEHVVALRSAIGRPYGMLGQRGSTVVDRVVVRPDRRLGRAAQAHDARTREAPARTRSGSATGIQSPLSKTSRRLSRTRSGGRSGRSGTSMLQRRGRRVPERDRRSLQQLGPAPARAASAASARRRAAGGQRAEHVVDRQVEAERRDGSTRSPGRRRSVALTQRSVLTRGAVARPSRPWARPVEPEVKITYARSSGVGAGARSGLRRCEASRVQTPRAPRLAASVAGAARRPSPARTS